MSLPSLALYRALFTSSLSVYHYSVGEGEERYAVVTRIDPQRKQQAQRQPHTLSRAPSVFLTSSGSTMPQSSGGLRVKKSMPDMKTLHSQAPRLVSRPSNGNIREGYATIASPSRRISNNFNSLFSDSGNSGGFGGVPPVPSLPSSIVSAGVLNGHDNGASVVRQPRGPGVGGFTRRDSRIGLNEAARSGALDTRSHEPLDI
ncbi:hypothetical protein EYR36_000402 [Pleurotus pulmonarius]|nr:hypothetical protein EYR36_000402 [Pleurotus pulmonarius]